MMPYLLISATLLQERRYLISAADARIKTMMTSSQTSPMPHIIPDVMPFIIMVHLTWLASDKSQFLNGSKGQVAPWRPDQDANSYCCEFHDFEN
jgi:hypothetical protein